MTEIDEDKTPIDVIEAIMDRSVDYPRDECVPCGAVMRMGFFFDAFGRHRDHDDPDSSKYSNICRLWEAHRDMRDKRRPANQDWHRFYYSGLGTPLNEDAESREWVGALKGAGSIIADDFTDFASDHVKNFVAKTARTEAFIERWHMAGLQEWLGQCAFGRDYDWNSIRIEKQYDSFNAAMIAMGYSKAWDQVGRGAPKDA